MFYWDLHFVLAIQDWGLESLMTFMDTIYGLVIRGIGEDKMCWKPGQKKGFKVGNYYHLLVACNHQWAFFPLENHVEIKGPSESSLLCMDYSFG